MAGKLAEKVAVVTGASSGIGQATAVALAQEGARVVVAARRAERLTDLVRRIKTEGGKAVAVETDVTSEGRARALVDRTNEHFGRLDILVNNAGIMLPAPFDRADPREWRTSFEVNVLGMMYVTQAALPLLKVRGGNVVNVSSTAGRETRPGFAAYDASKYGVVGFSDALRREVFKDKVRVTCIEPGAVSTELVQNIGDEQTRNAAQQYVGNLETLQPEDVAAAIVYAVTQPDRVQVNELLIRPTAEE